MPPGPRPDFTTEPPMTTMADMALVPHMAPGEDKESALVPRVAMTEGGDSALVPRMDTGEAPVFPDYDSALAGAGDPMAPTRPGTPEGGATRPGTLEGGATRPGTPGGGDKRIVNTPVAEAPGAAVDDGDFVFPDSEGGVDPALVNEVFGAPGVEVEMEVEVEEGAGVSTILSYCAPLERAGCGLLASPTLTSGLLEYIEEGNTGTRQINTFLDAALGEAVGEMAAEVVVEVGELEVEGGGVGGGAPLVGRGCSDGVEVGAWRVEAGSTGRAVLRGEQGVQGIQGRGVLGSLSRGRGWLVGEVEGSAGVRADLRATYRRDILVKCLTVTEMVREARTELAGRMEVVVRLEARDMRVDYRTADTAELHLTVGLRVEGELTGLGGEAEIDGCFLDRWCTNTLHLQTSTPHTYTPQHLHTLTPPHLSNV